MLNEDEISALLDVWRTRAERLRTSGDEPFGPWDLAAIELGHAINEAWASAEMRLRARAAALGMSGVCERCQTGTIPPGLHKTLCTGCTSMSKARGARVRESKRQFRKVG